MPSSSIAIQQKRKKKVTFGDTDVVLGNDSAHDVQETPSSPSSHCIYSPPHTSATANVDTISGRGMEDEQASVLSSSLPTKSSLTRLLEQSSSSRRSSGDNDYDNNSNGARSGTGSNPAAVINSQRNYRDIKQRYFQSLGVRQQQLQQQQQRLPPTRRRSASEAIPTSPQRQQYPQPHYGIPIPNRDGPSPLAMALEREAQLRSASVDSPSPAQAIPINGASAHVGVQRRSASQDMASTLGVSLSVRKHVRYLGEYGDGLEEDEEVCVINLCLISISIIIYYCD